MIGKRNGNATETLAVVKQSIFQTRNESWHHLSFEKIKSVENDWKNTMERALETRAAAQQSFFQVWTNRTVFFWLRNKTIENDWKTQCKTHLKLGAALPQSCGELRQTVQQKFEKKSLAKTNIFFLKKWAVRKTCFRPWSKKCDVSRTAPKSKNKYRKR